MAEETTVDEEEQDAVKKEEAEIDEDTGGEIFYVDLDPDTGGDIADDGLGHAVNTNRLTGEGILKQADGGSREGSGDGIATGYGEEDCDDQGEIEDGKARKRPRKESLKENRTQRNQESNCGRETMLLELSAGCVTACGHEDSGHFSVVRS